MALIDAYAPIALHGPTGATAATRYAGGTTSGAPASGTFSKGDFVIAQDGHVFVCTVAGSPGTWTDIGFGGSGITQLTGDVTAGPGSGSQAATLATSGVTAATYGDSTHVGQVAVDAKGRVTSASNVLISGTAPAAGGTLLIYRYTVTGSDKASIDTGVDTPDAGSNDWTNGDLLEVFIYARTDETAVQSNIGVTFNNDATGVYDNERLIGTTVASGTANANQTLVIMTVNGASATASAFGSGDLIVPNYGGTVGHKAGRVTSTGVSSTATQVVTVTGFTYRSTTAISRLAVAPQAGGKKLKVGTQLLIYKRVSS